MAHLEQLIAIISRPPPKRSDPEVTSILPWLRRRTELMPQLDKDTAMEVVRHCTYEFAERDDVILQQGDEGESMYLILQGTISVYIDASLTGEEAGADPFQTPTGSPQRESPDKQKSKQLERSHYGKFIIKYESGKQFGEAALLGEDKTRNATILADENCHLLVISQRLFDSSLKEHQEREFRVMQNFVERHPLFSHMSAKYKRLLELSLRRVNFDFDTPIVTQGDRHKSLFFIISGQAKIVIEPAKHQKQYSHLWPFETGSDIYSQEFEWLRESRRAAVLRKYEDPAVWPTKPDSLVLRRTEGYAASERSIQDRTVTLCSVQDGEIVGDYELVQSLDTYLQTVICTAPTQTLVLDVKNLDRVTGKRNALTLTLLKAGVLEKLDARLATLTGPQVPFLGFIHAKLTELVLPEKKALPPLKISKTLPSKEIQNQHMLERYLEGKAELVESCVAGTLIYKDIMAEKTRVRNSVRRRSNMGVSSQLREARRKMNRRKPRSRREIVDSLKEMIEAELVEASAEGRDPGSKDDVGKKTAPAGRGGPQGSRRPSMAPSEVSVDGTPRKKSLVAEPPEREPKRPSLARNSLEGNLLTPRKRSSSMNSDDGGGGGGGGGSGAATPRRGSGTTKPLLLPHPPPPPPAALARKSSLTSKDKSRRDPGAAKKRVTLPPLDLSEGADGKGKNSENSSGGGSSKSSSGGTKPRSRSNSIADLSLPQIPEEHEERREAGERGDADRDLLDSGGSAPNRYVRREVPASSQPSTPSTAGGSNRRLPPLAKVEIRRPEHVPNERWNAALRFVNDRIHDRFTTQLLQDGGSPGLRDYETSEPSLQLLESRIKQFHVKHGQNSPVRLNLKLPKLRRYKLDLEDEEQRLPKPGGKVWIKKRLCQIANSKFKVKEHEHIRYHMVPELPEFDKVKKMQTVMQQLMDTSVLKKQGEQSAAENSRSSVRKASMAGNGSEHTASFV